MKIAVVGSREFKDKEFVFDTLREIPHCIPCASLEAPLTIVSVGARGVDTLAETWVDDLNSRIQEGTIKKIQKIIFKPDWNKYGKKAGFLHNKLIIDEVDKVIVFWDGKSKGTKHSIDLAIEVGKPIDIYIRS